MTRLHKFGKAASISLGVLVGLVFLLMALFYLPPVQRWAADKAMSALEEKTGIRASIDNIRLTPFFDFRLNGFSAVDAEGDTLVQAGSLLLDVAFLPLWQGRADISGFDLEAVRLSTKQLVPDVRIKGVVARLSAETVGVDGSKEKMRLDRLLLSGADLAVALSDTAQKDTASAPSRWVIEVGQAQIRHSRLSVSMPGDTLHLSAHMGDARLVGGRFDLSRPHYAFRRLTIADGAVSMNTSALPLPKDALFDIRHLSVVVDTLSYDSHSRLQCGVRHVSFSERLRGLSVSEIGGRVYTDSLRLSLPDLRFRTPHSRIDAAVELDRNALTVGKGGRMHLLLNGHIGMDDLIHAAHAVLTPTERQTWQRHLHQALPAPLIAVKAEAEGNMNSLALRELTLRLPDMATLSAKGFVNAVSAPHRSGHISFSAAGHNLAPVRSLLPPDLRTTIRFPRHFTLGGNVDFRGDRYRSDFWIMPDDGQLVGNAEVDLSVERYALNTRITRFPISQFLNAGSFTPLSAQFSLRGKGFDPLGAHSHLHADAHIGRLHYDRFPLDDLSLSADVEKGNARLQLSTDNALVSGRADVAAKLRRIYEAEFDIAIDRLDMQRLTASTDTATLGFGFKGALKTSQDFDRLSADGRLNNIRIITPHRGLMLRDIDFDFVSTLNATSAQLSAGDLSFEMTAADGWERLARRMAQLSDTIARQIARRHIDQTTLRNALPEVSLHLAAGTENPLSGILRHFDYRLSNLSLRLDSDPAAGLNGHFRAGGLEKGGLVIDTLHASLTHDDEGMKLKGTIRNDRHTNPNPFTARLNAYLFENGVGADLSFADGSGETGLSLGAKATLEADGTKLSFYPETAIVAYRRFVLNPDNFIFFGNDRTIRADLNLLADDGTGLQVYSAGADPTKNDITFSLKEVNLKELSNVVPYLPEMGGHLSGDFHLIDDHRHLSAMGTMEARNFSYEGATLGTLGAELVYMPKDNDEHYADVFITFEGQEVAECSGSYFNKGEGSFVGTAELKTFPLHLLNGFFEGTEFALRGTGEGAINLSGKLNAPLINGRLDLNNAHIYSKVYGVDFAMDERPVEFNNSRLEFSDYALTSTDDNALTLNGHIDMNRLDDIRLALDMKAENFALINARRQRESLVYGKVFTDFSGTVRGTLDKMRVKGRLDVLGSTDVTYLLMNSPLSVNDELDGLVTFTDFSDTIAVALPQEEKTSGFDLSLGVNVHPGANFHCFLSNDGESYVDVSGEGNLRLRMTRQGEMRLTGRLTLDEGKMNYELPVIPLRTFTLVPGSFVEFKGDVMNPTLGIKATDRIKTIITEDNRQRAVVFNAGVNITRTLEDMGLEFIIEAPEDLSLQNRLAAMSSEDRGKAAVALLATGMYISDDNLSAGGLKASNALNAFLQSEIQNIAGKALSTIDVSLGLESGVSASGAATTDYSFQFSKRFWNNRMRVIVGGKVSTGAEATNNSESFIDNIALEYRLDTSGSRYVRVFYDRDSHDPLEGTLMKTGAGLVLRRKSDNIGDLFLFRRKKTPRPSPTSETQP